MLEPMSLCSFYLICNSQCYFFKIEYMARCRASTLAETRAAVADKATDDMEILQASDYQGEAIFLEYINSGVVSTTEVAPMDIDDMRSTLLSKDKKASRDAVKVYGPAREILEVRDWVTLVKNNWLEKWRQHSAWYGDDGKRHSLSGKAGLLKFMEVIPIDGPVREVAVLRMLVPCELLNLKKNPRKARKGAAKEREDIASSDDGGDR